MCVLILFSLKYLSLIQKIIQNGTSMVDCLKSEKGGKIYAMCQRNVLNISLTLILQNDNNEGQPCKSNPISTRTATLVVKG